MAQQFVKERLKSPATAVFGSAFTGTYQHIMWISPNRFQATGWVDSQNGYGALLRTHFTVLLERSAGGNWTAISGATFNE